MTTPENTVRNLMERRSIDGVSIAVTDREGLLWAAGLGTAKTTTDHLWFSMSKVVTATAAMRLADEGRLDLDAARPSGTVRQLLSHTAGLGNPLPLRWVRPAEMPATDLTERLIRRHGTPKRTPGGTARYSNVGYLLLGKAIEEASGMPFTDYVRTAVLEPAGLYDTGYAYRPGADRATGYVGGPAVVRPLLKSFLPPGIVGPRVGGRTALKPLLVEGPAYGGLLGNVLDAARLARLHLRDGEIDGVRVLSAAAAIEMRDLRYPGRPFDHGLAWFRKPGAGSDHVEHYGAGAGFWNAIRLYPDAGLGMAVMANTTAAYDVHALFTELRAHFGTASNAPPPSPPEVPATRTATP